MVSLSSTPFCSSILLPFTPLSSFHPFSTFFFTSKPHTTDTREREPNQKPLLFLPSPAARERMAAAAAVAAVVVAAVVAAAASAAAPASAGEPTRDVRWEVGYMTVAPLGVSQKVWWRAMACALFLISSEKFGPPCLIFSSSFFLFSLRHVLLLLCLR